VTPAVKALESAEIPFQLLRYDLPQAGEKQDIGMAAAQALSLDPASVLKTLIAELNTGELGVAVIEVAEQLDMKALARAAAARSAAMAERARAERVTGFTSGGISPVGQKRRLRTFLSDTTTGQAVIHVSAGKRGLELALTPDDLIRITGATVCPLMRNIP
jgi:Cys-tRNA(Pro)/Cys-tRNA(Cys) deacylase